MVVVWVGWEVWSFCFSWGVDVTAVLVDIHIAVRGGNADGIVSCAELFAGIGGVLGLTRSGLEERLTRHCRRRGEEVKR